MMWQDEVEYNFNEESDSIALSYVFSERCSFSSLEKIQRNLSKIVGSITGNILSDESPSKVLIMKKGSQGMFLGKNNDRIYFASDAYGLVEDCNKVYNLDNNCFGFLDLESNELGLKVSGIDSSFNRIIKAKDYINVIITSRDVSKKGFKHYLLKEIYESKDIVESTLRRYIRPEV